MLLQLVLTAFVIHAAWRMLLRFSDDWEAVNHGLGMSAALSLVAQVSFGLFSISDRMKMPTLLLIGLVSERVFAVHREDSITPSYCLVGRRFLVLTMLVNIACSSGLQFFIQTMSQLEQQHYLRK